MLIAWRVLCHFLTGGGGSIMSVAPRHQRGGALAPNKACLIESFNAAWRSTAMRAVREKFGIVGEAKVFEVTHGENGWHPHLHVLLFHGEFLDITEGEEQELVVTFWREFNKQLAKWATKTCQHPKAARSGVSYAPVIECGRPTGRRKASFSPPTNAEFYGLDPSQVRDADLAHGINFVPITPDGEAGNKIAAYVGKIQLEMTRSDLKTGKTAGSRSVFQIMNDYGHHGDPADGALIQEVADVLKGVQLVVWSGAFYGDDPLYGEPTDEFAVEMTAAYYESQGLEPADSEREIIGGTAADVHRAADRANTSDGHPLLWRARIVLEQTGQLDDVAALFNELLAPVYVDRNTELPYPIIRFADPPTVTIERSGGLAQPLPEHEQRRHRSTRRTRKEAAKSRTRTTRGIAVSALGDNDRLAVSVAEAARLLGIGRTMAYKCVRTGELPSVTLGGRILVPRAALDLLVVVELNDDRAA